MAWAPVPRWSVYEWRRFGHVSCPGGHRLRAQIKLYATLNQSPTHVTTGLVAVDTLDSLFCNILQLWLVSCSVPVALTPLTCAHVALLYHVLFTCLSWSSPTWQDCVTLLLLQLVKSLSGFGQKVSFHLFFSALICPCCSISLSYTYTLSFPPSFSPFPSPSLSYRMSRVLICSWLTACASLKRFVFSRSVSVCKWVMQLSEAPIMWGEYV